MNKKLSPEELSEHFFRHTYAKMLAILSSYFGLEQLEIAEDIVQDCLVEALQKWSIAKIPDNPEAWLMDVAKKKTINFLKRKSLFDQKIAQELSLQIQAASFKEVEQQDSDLKMIFACCHPALAVESQIALALKTLCGLSVQEIADSLLTTKANINKRLYRAKEKFRSGEIKLENPAADEPERLDSVLQVLYLLFNEGYFSLHHEEKIRIDLCYEAIRLLNRLEETAYTRSPKLQGLLALMYFSIARFQSRIDPFGGLIAFEKQERSQWDQEMIAVGMKHLSQSMKAISPNIYQLQAGIMAEHCLAPNFDSTNWESILKQYEVLFHLNPQALIALNREIARFFSGDRINALKALEELEQDAHFHSHASFMLSKAILLAKDLQLEAANLAFEKATKFAASEAERKLILARRNQFFST